MEKHFLVMSSGLTEAQKQVTKKLQDWVEDFAEVFQQRHEQKRFVEMHGICTTLPCIWSCHNYRFCRKIGRLKHIRFFAVIKLLSERSVDRILNSKQLISTSVINQSLVSGLESYADCSCWK